jgi:hypothetical protein
MPFRGNEESAGTTGVVKKLTKVNFPGCSSHDHVEEFF